MRQGQVEHSELGRGMIEAENWCILTTAGTRTIPLARSLIAAGLDAWTPMRTVIRAGRGKQRGKVVHTEVGITPTFVFVSGRNLADILRILRLPTSPHPPFRILRQGDRIPLVRDASLQSLRAAEDRFRQSLLKTIRRRIKPKTTIRVAKGPFAGMTGIVEASTNNAAQVNFGGGFVVSIASYLFESDVIMETPQPITGNAE